MGKGSFIAAATVLGTGFAVASCNAQVLSVGGGNALPDIAGATTIDALTDAQATTLCNWLIDAFPEPGKTMPPQDNPGCGDPVPGYVSDRSFSCGSDQGVIWWTTLNVSDCIANLRHSPCHSTLDSLEQCIRGYSQSMTGCSYSNSNACAAYFSDPACSETVLKDVQYPADNPNQAFDCNSCLPIKPGVTCSVPLRGSADGGGAD